MTFLEETSGVLQSVATRALGLSDFNDWSVARGRGLGLANYLLVIFWASPNFCGAAKTRFRQ